MDNISPTFIVDPLYYNENSLIISSITIFIFSYLFGKLIFKSVVTALFVATIKSWVYLIFFLFFFNNHNFHFIDSITYLNDSVFFFENHSFLEMLLEPKKIVFPRSGGHPFYFYWSYISFFLFGPYIHSPITLNILSTFLGAYYLCKISKEFFDLSIKNSILLSVIYCLHLEVLPWSSFFNLRDILIQVTIISLIYFTLKFANQNNLKNFIMLFLALFILRYLRTHMAYLFFVCLGVIIFCTTFFFKKKNISKMTLISLTLFFFLILIIFLYEHHIFLNIYNHWLEKSNLNFVKILRLFISPLPIPKTMVEGYGFLIFASFINLLTIPLLVLGIFYTFRIKKNILNSFVLFFIFFMIIILIGLYQDIQGPRQRLMITPIVLMYTYFGFCYFITNLKKNVRKNLI